MEPIINPIFFYFVDIVPNVQAVCQVAVAIGIGYICIRKVASIDEEHPYKTPKALIAATVAGFVLAVCIPSQETLYKMAIAKFVTRDNVAYVAELVSTTADNVANGVKDGVTDFVKDIMSYSADTVNEIRKGE